MSAVESKRQAAREVIDILEEISLLLAWPSPLHLPHFPITDSCSVFTRTEHSSYTHAAFTMRLADRERGQSRSVGGTNVQLASARQHR